jgi:alpha-D-xyloside xylohydrolase
MQEMRRFNHYHYNQIPILNSSVIERVNLMKFSDGNWMTRKGYEIISPVEVHSLEADHTSLSIVGPPRPIVDRYGELDTPLIEVRLSSPSPDVIRVQMFHHKGQLNRGPHFSIHESNPQAAEIIQNETEASLKSGNLSVHIDKQKPWKVDFQYNGTHITSSGYKSMGYIIGENEQTYMREQLDLDVGEYVYGLGERFTSLVKNGQSVDIWNRDGGTGTEQAYKNIPFYLTNKGYGVFINHPELVSFEVASEKVSKVQFSVSGEYLEYYLIGGPSMKQVLENYTTLTGKPALPPAWSFGLWLTTSFTTNYDEKTVTQFVDGMAERDLPLHVFHFDCFWMKEFQWCNFEWDERVFPDPEEMLTRLKNKGLKICVWINPYIGQRSKLFDEGMKKGYLLKKANGDVWQWDLWQPGMAVVDFTNPEACQWYGDLLRKLIDMGVDSFKTDFGERIPTNVVYYDGSDPQKMHNYYVFLYNKVVFEVLKEKLGEGEAAVFARSATVGSQQFPVHWANYPSMAESLRGGLSLGLSGFGFWSHDIGGFESTATADVYKRWVAFGLLSSHSRLHGNRSYRVPWIYDVEAVDVLRFFTKLKCRLMPYIFSAACSASLQGIAVMRAMVLEFEADPATHHLDRQYMLGDALLVAPIFNEIGMASYYLPQGTWTHFITGEIVVGGIWRKEEHSYLSVPLYVRPNSIIAIGNEENKPDYDYADGVEFHIFELSDGNQTSSVVYNTKGTQTRRLTASRKENTFHIQMEGTGDAWSVILRGIYTIKFVQGANAISTPLGIQLIPLEGIHAFYIEM